MRRRPTISLPRKKLFYMYESHLVAPNVSETGLKRLTTVQQHEFRFGHLPQYGSEAAPIVAREYTQGPARTQSHARIQERKRHSEQHALSSKYPSLPAILDLRRNGVSII